MKKIVKLLLIVVLMIPLIIFADTFERGQSKANKYMKSGTYVNSYEKYLVSKGSIPFEYTGSELKTISGFENAGFLSKYEYDVSLINGKSYLYKGSKYWSLTAQSSKHYVIGSSYEEDSKNNHTRVTEYVLPDTVITGSGTQSDPWTFKPLYKVTFYSNNIAWGQIGANNNSYIASGESASVQIIPTDGYRFYGSDCNAVYRAPTNTVKVNNVTRDIRCKILFGINLYTITLGEESDNISPREMYLKYDEDYYKDSDAKNVMNNLDSWPHEKAGYKFDGLETPDTNVLIIDQNGKVKHETNNVMKANTTLQIRWKPNTYTVSFDTGGGTPQPSQMSVTYGSAYGTLPTVNKVGHSLDGWYTGATNGSLVEATTNVTTASNHTLYARWSVGIYRIELDNQEATTEGTEAIYEKYNTGWYSDYLATTAISKITLPTKTGYTFKGYYTEVNGGGNQIIDGSGNILSGKTTEFSNSETLYAYWEANTYTVTFNQNGGNAPSVSSMSVTYDGTYGSLATVTRTGYTFDGWYTSDSGGTKVTSSTVVEILANQTLYAHWIANTYTVTFNSNGGNTPSVASISVTYDEPYGSLASVTRSGHTFEGWFTSETGGTEVTGGTTVKITANQTLYAHWKMDDPVAPVLSVSVSNGTTYAKSRSATITISDETSLAAGTYIIKYAWGTSAVACTSMSNSTSISVSAGDKSKSVSVTISSGTGAGKIYVCNTTAISDTAGNSLAANTVKSANMYLDNTAPASSFDSDNTSLIKCTDSVGVTAYYLGTSSSPASSAYTTVTSTTSLSVDVNITSAGTHYLFCKDAAGNTSSAKSYSYKSIAVTYYKNTTSSDTSKTNPQTFIEGGSGNQFGRNSNGSCHFSNCDGQFGAWNYSNHTLLGWSRSKTAQTQTWDPYSGVSDEWIRNNAPSIDIYAIWKPNGKFNCARKACRDGGTVNSGGFPSVNCCFAAQNCYYDSCGSSTTYPTGTTWKQKPKGSSAGNCTSYCIIKDRTSCPSGYVRHSYLGLEGC